MDERPYTLARWQAKPGHEDGLVEAWNALAEFFLGLPHRPGQGTLLQSLDDPTLFYSFGAWDSLEDIAAMRAHPDTADAFARLIAECEEATPGSYRVVAQAG